MSERIEHILGRVPSGVFILTATGPEGEETGMLSSWVMQAGFVPPMLTVAVRHGRYLGEWLAAGRPFNLNIVAEGQKHLLSHFGRGFEPGQPAFTGIVLARCSRGVPILSATVGHLECIPARHVDSGDHRIFLAQITGGRLTSDVPPMTHVRKSGLHY